MRANPNSKNGATKTVRVNSELTIDRSVTGTLADIGHTFSSLDCPWDRIRHVLERVRLIVPHECCGLLHFVGGTEEIVVVPTGSAITDEIEHALRHQLSYLEGTHLLPDRRLPEELGRCQSWSSHLTVPLVSEDTIVGLLMIVESSSQPYEESDLSLLTVVAEQLAAFLALLSVRQREMGVLQREQDARRTADAANRAKDRLLSIVSHELRDPVSVLAGWAQQLLTRPADPELTKKAASVIERNATLLGKLIADLIDFGRLTRGDFTLERRLTDLNEVLRLTIDALSAGSKGVTIDVTMPAGATMINGDPTRLGQVLRHLIANAVKFTDARGRIEVSLARQPDAARIAIKDTGIGIDADFLPFVFDEFRQEHEARDSATRGIGLGLAISKHLVDLHGGRLEAFSEGRGRGATFVVTLPRRGVD